MKINFSDIDLDSFQVKDVSFRGEELKLIIPQHINTKWTRENKIFRSSVWNRDGELVSASFPKFVNWGEKPEIFPTPRLEDCRFVEKLDGSALIISCYKGETIFRTRGTIDARAAEKNGHEIDIFQKEYPQIVEYVRSMKDISLILEWYSPLNRIVIRYGDKPTWKLIGGVYHDNYELYTQDDLDALASELNIERPKTVSLQGDVISWIKFLVDTEGFCAYSNKGQDIHKIKTDWYLARHRMKETFRSFDNVLDYYIAEGMPDFPTFKDKIENLVDFETVCEIMPDAIKCVEGYEKAKLTEAEMRNFVKDLLTLGSPSDKLIRARQARKIIEVYKSEASMLFNLLDGNDLEKWMVKKLIKKL